GCRVYVSCSVAVVLLPALSIAVAATVLVPGVSDTWQTMVPPPTATGTPLQVTDAIPDVASATDPAIVTSDVKTAGPFGGGFSDSRGGALSMLTVTPTVVWLPAASLASPLTICDPDASAL